VFFLQVGANDGLMDDPIHFLVRKYGWCGVLLEPDRSFSSALKCPDPPRGKRRAGTCCQHFCGAIPTALQLHCPTADQA
jgi:hypothetical protein